MMSVMEAESTSAEGEGAAILPILKVRAGVPILSAQDGPLYLDEERRKMAILFADGALYVATGHMGSSAVASYEVRVGVHQGRDFLKQIFNIDMRNIEEAYNAQVDGPLALEDLSKEGDVSQEIVAILREAARRGASDVHLTVLKTETRVEIREHGDLVSYSSYSVDMGRRLCSAAFQMSDIREVEYNQNAYQAGRLNGSMIGLGDLVESVRGQWNPLENGGRALVMRLLYALGDPDLSSLGFVDQQSSGFARLRRRAEGVILVSGPTGSGKSTTLTTNIKLKYEELGGRRKFITVEDPPEYILGQGILQFGVTETTDAEKRGDAFLKAFRAALRSDPDIMMVGEIRDGATGDAALRFARSGHQVWTSVHVNNALEIIPQLEELGVSSAGLFNSDIITGLVGQRLVKQLCPTCAREVTEREDGELYHRHVGLGLVDNGQPRTKGRGCGHCRNLGYVGRTVIAEIIEPDREFMRIMADRDTDLYRAREYWLQELNGQTFVQHGLAKVSAGEISLEDLEITVGSIGAREARGGLDA